MQSFYLMVAGTTIHYYSAGSGGKPLVFVHGMPTSAYMWRHILDKLSPDYHCIAVDLVGMGKSGKPHLPYTVQDHLYYFEAFMEALALTDVTLVMHGWGSIIGFSYAARHPDKIAGLAFSEGYITLPNLLRETSLLIQEVARPIAHVSPEALKKLVLEENYIIEHLLPSISLKALSADAWDTYRAPFQEPGNRGTLWQFAQEQPFFNPHSPAHTLIQRYAPWLCATPIKKLMMYALPGLLFPMETVHWAKTHFSNLRVAEVGMELHCLPEHCATNMASALTDWI